MDNIFTVIIMGILSLDTIRAIIAMTGWVKPDKKYSWIIYGRYERNLIISALKELGFTPQKSKKISNKLSDVSKEVYSGIGVSEDNVVEWLIALLAKYIVKFDKPIQYGGRRTTKSYYYIDTMGLSHCEEDLKVLSSIMIHLYNKKSSDSIKPDVIVTPKGGNPLLGLQVARHYGSVFVMAKSDADKSRITSVDENNKMNFLINYEGAWNIDEFNDGGGKCIIIDCNTSGGSQLLNIVKDITNISNNEQLNINNPNEAYVLFCADDQVADINKRFKSHNCSLYRFFDLDEELKEMLYSLKNKCKTNDIEVDIYFNLVSDDISKIIDRIKEKNKYYYEDKNVQ